MSDEAAMAVSNAQNPSAVHALIVPTMPIATDNGMGRIERPALVPRSELERVERELAVSREQIELFRSVLVDIRNRTTDATIMLHPDADAKGCVDDCLEWSESALSAVKGGNQ